MNLNVIDEQYPGKVVGVYNREASAKKMAEQLISEGGFLTEQLSVVRPDDGNFAGKLEPDSKGIGRTLLKSHLILGSAGLVVGLLVASLLIIIGSPFAASSPVMMLSSAAILGTFLGLLVAGAISLRPDHDGPINSARHASHHHQWSVVVQTKDHEQIEQARKLMQPSAVKLSESL